MYTRDRSTPRTDAFYGGKDDLSAAFAYEEDGTTVVFFRKPLAAKELPDQPLKNAPTLLIWAQGQEHGNYVHSPKTGLDEGHASVLDFYRTDELKYHGHKDQRGSTVINFHGETRRDPCQGEWRYPSTCRGDSCTYSASWLANPHTEEVSFEIRSKIADRWTGLGFSEDRRMPNTDAVIGWVEKNGRFFVYDMWLSGYKEPSNDVRSDLFNVSGEHADGMTTLRFARKFDTGDKVHDLAFTEGHCLHLVFPVAGGTYNSVLRKIGRHAQNPAISKTTLCLHGCREPPPKRPPPPPPSLPPAEQGPNGGSSDACSGSWRFPDSCAADDCEYTASWHYQASSDQVFFTITTRSNKWTGIGFSTNKAMPKTDAILGWVEETGRYFIMDVWMEGYEPPLLDPVQDVANMSGHRRDGRTTLSFARQRYSDDVGYDLDLDQCLYLVFPTHGGVFNAVSKKIRKHEQRPLISSEPVCFTACHPQAGTRPRPSPGGGTKASTPAEDGGEGPSITPPRYTPKGGPPRKPTTPAPPSLEEYHLRLQVLEPWQASYGVRGSRPYSLLSQQLTKGLEPALNEVSEKHQIKLKRLIREPDGVVAEMQLLLPTDHDSRAVEESLRTALLPGQLLGGLRVNPASLQLHVGDAPESRVRQSSLPGSDASGEESSSEQIKLYAIVGAVAALVFLLLVQAASMACRRKLRTQPPPPNREKLLTSSHWKDYSTTASSNYSYENFALRPDEDLGPPAGAPRAASVTYDRGPARVPPPATNPYATAQRRQPQEMNPDFYFMPHQRRYSGEVVRVFVDYSNPEYTGAPK